MWCESVDMPTGTSNCPQTIPPDRASSATIFSRTGSASALGTVARSMPLRSGVL